jgi:lycopene cyclase domain-containing protein
MKAAYLLIDLASLAFPLAFCRSERFGFGRAWPRAWAAVALSAVPFLLWDVGFAKAGVWSFNPRYVLGPSPLGLPAEEWLFFLAIPFACLFIYRRFAGPPRAGGFRPDRPGMGFAAGSAGASLILAAAALAHADRPYTFGVGLAGAAAAAALALFRPRYARPFLAALAVQYLPFLIVNGILTALPVVRYDEAAILGPRIFTIPVEDSVYAFVLLALPVGLFEALGPRRAPASVPAGPEGARA